jgi:accessory gene regulator protein AgrB
MTEENPQHLAEVRRRQRGRAIIMGLLLAAFAALIYGITIVRMTGK